MHKGHKVFKEYQALREKEEYKEIEEKNGDKGDRGDRGERGEKGDPFRYEDFTPEQLSQLVGPQGERGVPGEQGTQGERGLPGENATINGKNAIEIQAGTNIELEETATGFKINTVGICIPSISGEELVLQAGSNSRVENEELIL